MHSSLIYIDIYVAVSPFAWLERIIYIPKVSICFPVIEWICYFKTCDWRNWKPIPTLLNCIRCSIFLRNSLTNLICDLFHKWTYFRVKNCRWRWTFLISVWPKDLHENNLNISLINHSEASECKTKKYCYKKYVLV